MAASAKGLDFARAVLEKYGWRDGKGLGRNEDGIVKALKPAMKFDQAGFGHTDVSDQLTCQWWEQAYNKVAKTITVVENKGDVQIQQKNREELFKSEDARPASMFIGRDYNDFVKTDIWTAEGVKRAVPVLNIDTSLEKDVLTDEEIFQACGGRTVHKGARHGLMLNGKLARIQRQEQEIIIKYQSSQPNANTSDFEMIEENKKLIKPPQKHKSSIEGTAIGTDIPVSEIHKKRKKKKDEGNTDSEITTLSEPQKKRKKKEKTRRM